MRIRVVIHALILIARLTVASFTVAVLTKFIEYTYSFYGINGSIMLTSTMRAA